jgi:hypothetical protein
MVIGFDDSCPQFFWLVGQGGYGIQSAAGYSSLAATLIQHHGVTAELESCEVEISMFDVKRFRNLILALYLKLVSKRLLNASESWYLKSKK